MDYDMLYKIDSENETREIEFFKCVRKAADITHTITLARSKSENAVNAINSQDLEMKRRILQMYMSEYSSFINSMTYLTGIAAQQVDIAFYNNLSSHELNHALRITIDFVYFREALKSTAQNNYKDCLKKLLKKTGLFDKRILALL